MAELITGGARRLVRQDTFGPREHLVPESLKNSFAGPFEGVLDYDAVDSGHHRPVIEDEEEDDSSSQLSIPNESIDFDLVYSLRNFVATTEGQANVHKGDTLFLMDDSNSYWWLVRVLKTQDIGYIPAENIETPIERLARLNKHRNVDLASATPAEQDEDAQFIHARRNPSRGALTADSRSVVFTGSSVYYYPPFVWGDPGRPLDDVGHDNVYEEDGDDYAGYEDADQYDEDQRALNEMEPDDGISWEDNDTLSSPQLKRPGVVVTSRSFSDADQPPASQPAPFLTSHADRESIVGLGRLSASREQLPDEHQTSETQAQFVTRAVIDPVEAVETRKLSATPFVAREYQSVSSNEHYHVLSHAQRTLSISSVGSAVGGSEIASYGHSGDDAGTDADSKRLKGKPADRKLKKERSISGDSRDSAEVSDRQTGESREKIKKVGFLGGLFGRKKDKGSTRPAAGPTDINPTARSSAESMLTTSVDHTLDGRNEDASPRLVGSPSLSEERDVGEPRVRSRTESELFAPTPPQVTGSSPSESAQAGLLNPAVNNALQPPARGARPGSLIISSADGLGAPLPELSVLRVFAGDHLQSEATFKTVLINAGTTTAGLMQQAMQRFRLPEGEDPGDYYLTIKQVDGDEAILLPGEHPLQAFEQLTERAARIPAKRASIGSINSLASNLSMSIAKLGMNDFTDDSTVKLYLHRTVKSGRSDAPKGPTETASETIVMGSDVLINVSPAAAGISSVPPERFSSPSARFAVQVFIYPEDLPDGMVFDPHTEAIVPRSTLQHRSGSSATVSPGVSQTKRRKVFVFPKNTTVAEVIEASLERFGIVEGVVEGGDDVEDKPAKRRSSSRVRYGLNVLYTEGQQRELQPSSKVLDAFTRPPLFKTVDRRSAEWRRRSIESAQLMGTNDDIQRDDPIFILRKVTGVRNAKGKNAGPLDELALRQLHRESASSDASVSSSASSSSTHQGQQCEQDTLTVKPNTHNGVDMIADAGVLLNRASATSPSIYSEGSWNGPSPDTPSTISGPPKPTDFGHPRDGAPTPMAPAPLESASLRAIPPDGPSRVSPLPDQQSLSGPTHRTTPSIASVMSDLSLYTAERDTPRDASLGARMLSNTHDSTPYEVPFRSVTTMPGIARMLAMVELSATISQGPWHTEPTILDRMLLGTSVNLGDLHAQAMEFFAGTIHDMEEITQRLDHALQLSHQFINP